MERGCCRIFTRVSYTVSYRHRATTLKQVSGDQAEIVFTLSGEPPFTFTYQRSDLQTKKSNKPSKILETHTVTGVTTKEYSIYSSLEGVLTARRVFPFVLTSSYRDMDRHIYLRQVLSLSPSVSRLNSGKAPALTQKSIELLSNACHIARSIRLM